jgi:hypothetical protein
VGTVVRSRRVSTPLIMKRRKRVVTIKVTKKIKI